jgi:hypothetical protein
MGKGMCKGNVGQKKFVFFNLFILKMTQEDRIDCIIIFWFFYTNKIKIYSYENMSLYIFYINDDKLNNILVLIVSIHYRFVNCLF